MHRQGPSTMFSNQACRILTTVGHVGDITRYMAENCHNSSSSAINSTPENRESRRTAAASESWGVRPSGHDLITML